MISKGFYFSSKIEKNKGDRDFKKLLPQTQKSLPWYQSNCGDSRQTNPSQIK